MKQFKDVSDQKKQLEQFKSTKENLWQTIEQGKRPNFERLKLFQNGFDYFIDNAQNDNGPSKGFVAEDRDRLKRIWSLGKDLMHQFDRIERRTQVKEEIYCLFQREMKCNGIEDDDIKGAFGEQKKKSKVSNFERKELERLGLAKTQ